MAQFVNSGAVVLLLLASLAVLMSATPPKPSDWQVCDKHANYDVVVKNVTINPDPVVSGEEMTFIVPAYTGKEINGGSVIVSVSFHGVTVHTEKSNICDKARCPIAPGVFVLDNTEVLPGITPPGITKSSFSIWVRKVNSWRVQTSTSVSSGVGALLKLLRASIQLNCTRI